MSEVGELRRWLAATRMAWGPLEEALQVLERALNDPVPEVVLHTARSAELLGP